MNKCKCYGEKEDILIPAPKNSPHHAKILCGMCNRFVGWMPKPKNEGKRTQSSKYEVYEVARFHGFNREFCFFCGRNKEKLGDHEGLTVDHIIDYTKENDVLENLQILCKACHQLKNLVKLYFHKHLNRFYGKKNDFTPTLHCSKAHRH